MSNSYMYFYHFVSDIFLKYNDTNINIVRSVGLSFDIDNSEQSISFAITQALHHHDYILGLQELVVSLVIQVIFLHC